MDPRTRRYGSAMSMPSDPPRLSVPSVSIPAVWQQPPARSGAGPQIAAGIGIAFAGLVLLGVLGYLVVGLGVIGFLIAGVAALLPLSVVLLTVRWIDRWEPEPRSALWFAFLWGAGAAVATALLVDLSLQVATLLSGVQLQSDLTGAVIQAPIVEELAKGFGVLLILWAGRRYFDGPVDGLVYAATIAAGFAFTENVLYFGEAFVTGGLGDGLVTFVLRGVFSPFAHVMFTAGIGLALGAASRRTGALGAIGYFLLGLIPAVLLHALWNGAFYFVPDVVAYYFLVQVPLFLGAVGLVIGLRHYERRLTRARLEEYAAAGWFTADEVQMLSTWTGRSQALRWARARPGGSGSDRTAVMKRFVRNCTRLAHTRQRLLRGRQAIGSAPDEQSLLAMIVADRRALLG